MERPEWHTEQPAWMSALSPREVEVLDLVVRGMSNAEIACALYVSLPTVKTHVAQILRKVGARDRVQLVVTAFRSGYAWTTPRVPAPRRAPHET
ncbi:response regulator transcription factor [Nocardioides gansuensis]|nr:response regulator transcription factor [Nocardioides gansuensis]